MFHSLLGKFLGDSSLPPSLGCTLGEKQILPYRFENYSLFNAIQTSDGKNVSLFICRRTRSSLEEKNYPLSSQELKFAQNHFSRIKTLVHPYILKVFDTVENENGFFIKTEKCVPLISTHLKDDPAWPLYQISIALQFLNEECKFTHGLLSPRSIFVTTQGHWKLGSFDCSCDRNSTYSEIFSTLERHVFYQEGWKPPKLNGKLSSFTCLNIDRWGLASLLCWAFASFSMKSFPKSSTGQFEYDPSVLQKYLPPPLQLLVKELLLPSQQLVKLEKMFKENIFFKDSHLEEESSIAAAVREQFKSNNRGIRLVLLRNMDRLTSHLSSKDINHEIFDFLLCGFSDTSPLIRENTVKAMIFIIPKLTKPRTESVCRMMISLLKDSEPIIRTNTTICFAKVAQTLRTFGYTKYLVECFTISLNDGFTPCRISALQAVCATAYLLTPMKLVSEVMPSICKKLVDLDDEVRSTAFETMQFLMEMLQNQNSLHSQDTSNQWLRNDFTAENTEGGDGWLSSLAGGVAKMMKFGFAKQSLDFHTPSGYASTPSLPTQSTSLSTEKSKEILLLPSAVERPSVLHHEDASLFYDSFPEDKDESDTHSAWENYSNEGKNEIKSPLQNSSQNNIIVSPLMKTSVATPSSYSSLKISPKLIPKTMIPSNPRNSINSSKYIPPSSIKIKPSNSSLSEEKFFEEFGETFSSPLSSRPPKKIPNVYQFKQAVPLPQKETSSGLKIKIKRISSTMDQNGSYFGDPEEDFADF
ncbi:SCY kinase (incomplete catalytic triad) [Cardiosporidium cionae]|uniref:SCY kinase (Incomplete catalytic triad) n=1 Tax=Cardiosporidium cionae TaxID=476202 RepID=A0ABQ7J4A5_9APIC|nr:SCY kinase (incomplete catalytic triad) [Cardiosporidium cionae]|eukprot:KAF8817957.1 SCY kinase (incomplete catalytic triad) [Cardiosporidium cionae]